ncbi:MAG: T9SS C-terminal target domain-containing protein [Calditrichaeota bacterium]|nr:MAG: T9SS C-terminal target domain-containing protein [Calditrichota bacterium]
MRFFVIVFVVLSFARFAGSSVIVFSAVNPVTYEQVKLDSIRVENMTQQRDTTLVGIVSFDLETWTGVSEFPLSPTHFVLTENYPNSFDTVTAFTLISPRAETIKIQMFDILGRQILDYSQSISIGRHSFSLNSNALASGVYFLRATCAGEQRVIKMLKVGAAGAGAPHIAYLGAGMPSEMPLAKSQVTDVYRFTAFAAGYLAAVVEKAPVDNEAIQFEMAPPKPADDFTSGWRGFNLVGYFTVEWNNEGFPEEDFQMISDMGFNFVRLPIDYRIYTKAGDWYTFLESKLAAIDHAVEWGQEYGIHVSINLHRAPGYCVNPPSTPLPAKQDVSLWNNAEAQRAFAAHWRMFAERYRTAPVEALSFNLVNEPGNVSGEEYVNAVLPAIQAIREVSPDRIIITDAVDYGNGRIDAILSHKVVVSPHFYNPSMITHYKAEWVEGADAWPEPTWPPRMIPNYFYGSGKSPWNTPLLIQADLPSGTVITMHVQQVSSSADFRVYVGKEIIFKHDFRPGAGEGEWKEVIYRPEWNVYQNIYDRDYSFTLQQDVKEISFRVLSGDWMTWTELLIEPPIGSVMDAVVIQPGLTDWGVPQASYILQPNGDLILRSAPKGFEDKFRVNGFLQQWIDLKNTGVPVHVGEWGVYNKTPHDVTLAFMENRLLAMKTAGLGWALWNFRGSFGILDSDRKDVKYENYRGHQLDRKMLELLQNY